jgi:nitrogen regulatory protein PII-like uncharacterized protein
MASNIKQKDSKTGGKTKPKDAGPDTPGFTSTNEEDFFDQAKTILFNQFLGQDKPKTEDPKYPESPGVEKSKSKELEDVRKKVAPSGDKPTTAAAKKGSKKLPKTVQEVDPGGKAQQLPELYRQMQSIMGILSMGAGLGGGSGGGGDSGFTISGTPSGMNVVLTDGFVGALAILVRKFGFERVIKMFVLITLPNNGLSQLDSWYQPIVTRAVSTLLKVALYYGPLNIPVSSYDETYYGDIVPTNLVTKEQIPDFYVKQYYGVSAEPYPGYDQWIDPNNTANILYVRRELGTYVFSSASEEIYSEVERGIAADLDKYFYVDPTQYTIAQGADPLFPRYLNDVLDKWIKQIEIMQGDLMIGNNVGSGGGSGGMAAMMGMLIGLLMQLIQMFQQEQIGSKNGTVVGSVSNVIQDFQKQMGMSGQILQMGMSALGGGGLGNIAGMLGGMGGFGSLEGILGAAGLGDIGGMLGGLMGGFGFLGGNSGGGGGGAGSGFPDATIGGSGAWNDATNSGLSNNEISDMQTLISLLGIQDTSNTATTSTSSNTA